MASIRNIGTEIMELNRNGGAYPGGVGCISHDRKSSPGVLDFGLIDQNDDPTWKEEQRKSANRRRRKLCADFSAISSFHARMPTFVGIEKKMRKVGAAPLIRDKSHRSRRSVSPVDSM